MADGFVEILTSSALLTCGNITALRTPDIVFEFDLEIADWSTATKSLVSMDNIAGDGRAWRMGISSGGVSYGEAFDEAGGFIGSVGSGTVVTSDGVRVKVRYTYESDNFQFEVDTGSGFSDWYNGAETNIPANTSCTSTIRIFGRNSSETLGKIYSIQAWSDAARTTKVIDADFTTGDWSNLGSGLPDSQGNTWTITGTSGTDWDTTPWPTIWVA